MEHLLSGSKRSAPRGHRDGRDEARKDRRGVGFTAPEPLVRLALALERGAAHVPRCASRTAHSEARERDREDRDLGPLRIGAELVPVERQARLEAQRVARAEADRRRARRDEPRPKALDPFGAGEELEADPLARVAGARDEELPAFEAGSGVAIAALLGEGSGRHHRFQHPFGVRTLQGDHGERLALVLEVDVAFETRADPFEVVRAVRGVDHEEEMVLPKPVEVGVVLGAAAFVGDERVVRTAGRERGRVVGEDAAERRLRPGAPEPEPAHVGDVEETRVPAGREVLRDDPAPVLDRHIPPRKVDPPAAVRPVPVVERGPAQGTAGPVPGGGHARGRRSGPVVDWPCMGWLPERRSQRER